MNTKEKAFCLFMDAKSAVSRIHQSVNNGDIETARKDISLLDSLLMDFLHNNYTDSEAAKLATKLGY